MYVLENKLLNNIKSMKVNSSTLRVKGVDIKFFRAAIGRKVVNAWSSQVECVRLHCMTMCLSYFNVWK